MNISRIIILPTNGGSSISLHGLCIIHVWILNIMQMVWKCWPCQQPWEPIWTCILQDEQIWTSCRNNYSKQDVTIILNVERVLLCEWPEPVPSRWETLGVEFSADTLSANTSLESGEIQQTHSGVPESVQRLVKTLGGQLWVRSLCLEYPIDLRSPTRSDEDLSDLKKLYTASKPSKRQWCAPDTQCPDCDFVAVYSIDLYWHIKDNHLDSKSYACWDWDKNFQTDHDCTNHVNTIHRAKAFSCTVCLFTTAIEHRMLDHVYTHTAKRFECASYEMQLATKSCCTSTLCCICLKRNTNVLSVTNCMHLGWPC